MFKIGDKVQTLYGHIGTVVNVWILGKLTDVQVKFGSATSWYTPDQLTLVK